MSAALNVPKRHGQAMQPLVVAKTAYRLFDLHQPTCHGGTIAIVVNLSSTFASHSVIGRGLAEPHLKEFPTC